MARLTRWLWVMNVLITFRLVMPGKGVIAATISVEAIGLTFDLEAAPHGGAEGDFTPLATVDAYMGGEAVEAPVFRREAIPAGGTVDGPALITEATATTIVEPGWQAEMTEIGNLVLRRVIAREERVAIGTSCDPVTRCSTICSCRSPSRWATPQNTALSVNVKERLDFSVRSLTQAGR